MNRLLILTVVFAMSGCASRAVTPSAEQRKAPCDQLAARAIQSESLEVAKNLAAEASECYSLAQTTPAQ